MKVLTTATEEGNDFLDCSLLEIYHVTHFPANHIIDFSLNDIINNSTIRLKIIHPTPIMRDTLQEPIKSDFFRRLHHYKPIKKVIYLKGFIIKNHSK